jgi:hypothetical protein
MKSMIPIEPLLFFPVILNGYPASIARYHRKRKKKKKNPAAILMPCVKPSGMGFSGMGVLHITLASPQGPFK